MSVLINGMDMPREGTIMVVCEVNGQLCIVVRGAEPYPLVPVPPHGRVVDADELRIYYQHQEELALQDFEETDDPYCGGIAEGFHYAAKQLSCAPTIIPADKEEDA